MSTTGEQEPTLAEALALLDAFLGMVPGYHAEALADARAYRTSPDASPRSHDPRSRREGRGECRCAECQRFAPTQDGAR